ncbi:MAG: hypothetical protein ACRC2S_02285 [Waterburya sp.]
MLKTDIKELEITIEEQKKISGKNINVTSSENDNKFLPNFIVSLVVIGVIIKGFTWIFNITFYSYTILLAWICLSLWLSISMNNDHVNENEQIESLAKIISEIQKYNKIVKSIDVNDQLIEVGHNGMSEEKRKKSIKALMLVRQDLIKALKTEKILRENKQLITDNTEFFSNSLSELVVLQADEKASEFGKLLSDALEVAQEVQEEMSKIKNFK